MKYKIVLLIMLFLVIFQGNAYAVDPKNKNDLATESVICASYATIVETCLKERGNPILSKQYGDLANLLFSVSTSLSNEKITKKRFEQYNQEIMKLIGGRCEDVTRAISKYDTQCLTLAKNVIKYSKK
ncbi:hypothetical protein [Desulfovibrio litoralis]|uniref:Uncharacterized protein n=1 Tax=Desulfovibrio litoralis DSM 11393 TaxID=1121455 RepID=A0A1M7T2Z4_9BACT|nr:hypothetical protein [Desulfovibrio litoralis]SHN65061.1 hypothetical protein SAMN02745728_01488 [Desulfovibrio litoralis DSM 11393]